MYNAEKYEHVNSSLNSTLGQFKCANQGHAEVQSDSFRTKHAATERVKKKSHDIFLIAPNVRDEGENWIVKGQKTKSKSTGAWPKCSIKCSRNIICHWLSIPHARFY